MFNVGFIWCSHQAGKIGRKTKTNKSNEKRFRIHLHGKGYLGAIKELKNIEYFIVPTFQKLASHYL